MVNNCTKVNKGITISHPKSTSHLTQNRSRSMMLEIQVLVWYKNMQEFNQLMGSQSSPLNIWSSNVNTDRCINKQYKNCPDSLPFKKTTFTKMNDNINVEQNKSYVYTSNRYSINYS
jgi:hypothetical protein